MIPTQKVGIFIMGGHTPRRYMMHCNSCTLLTLGNLASLWVESWDKILTLSDDTYNLIGCLVGYMMDLEAWGDPDDEGIQDAVREITARALWEVIDYDD